MITVYQLSISRNVSLPSAAGLTADMTSHPAGLDHYNGGSILWFSFRHHVPNRCAWLARRCDGDWWLHDATDRRCARLNAGAPESGRSSGRITDYPCQMLLADHSVERMPG